MNLYKWLLWGKRTLIAVIILAGYGFYLVLERNQGLVQLGLISFVAVAQFLPGIVAVLFWSGATRVGFISGLVGGMLVWATTLLLPLLYRSGLISWEPDLLHWIGGPAADPWHFATVSSLTVNSVLFVLVSLFTKPSEEEQEAAEACRMTPLTLPVGVVSASSPVQFEEQLSRILGGATAKQEVRQALRDLNMSVDEQNPVDLRRLRERIERNLSGLMGPMLARMIVDERLQMGTGLRTTLADNVRFIEERVTQSSSELRGLAAQLDGLRRYHQQILHDLPIGVCSLGSDGRVVSWNLAMERISGVSAHQARGITLGQLPTPWDSLLIRFFEGGDLHQHKVRTEVDERPRWFNLHKASIEDPSAPRGIGGTVVLVEDLTEVQILEAELTHSERLASVGRLAAGVAHEIGNPVTGIACLAQNLSSESDDRAALETTEQILGQTDRINAIVRSLISFSHGGSYVEDKPVSVDVRECVDEAARLVQLSQAGKQIEIDIACPESLQLIGDRPRLLQVFVNLLSNACDASEAGDRIHVEGRANGNTIELDVADNGVGMSESLIDQAFEPFVTTKPPGQGTGFRPPDGL